LINPDSYQKVISHELRKKILNKLFWLSLNQPITKRQLSKAVNLGYESLCYQLNEHLKDFWEVKKTEKIRGAHQEYIAPKYPNTIFINVGEGGIIFIIDPLANLIGRISTVGTRCEMCSTQQQKKCSDSLKEQKCFKLTQSDRIKFEQILENNNRKKPFSPVDNMIVYTAKCLDKDGCEFDMNVCGSCQFLEKSLESKLNLNNKNN
jgi:hypothetical protein